MIPLCLPLADSGIGSTVYSDSHGSGLHSVIYQSLQDSVSSATQEVRITYPSDDDILVMSNVCIPLLSHTHACLYLHSFYTEVH